MRLPLLGTFGLTAICLLAGCGGEATDGGNGGGTDGGQTPAAAPKKMTTPTGAEMVLILAGTFEMGSNDGDECEKPVRKVTVDAFWMDATEVTQQSYKDLRGATPSKHPGEGRPVDSVGYTLAALYCNARSAKEGLKPCYDAETLRKCDYTADGYRLPTEAEWEYACRAGTTGAYSFGSSNSKLGDYGWFKENSGGATHPVKGKKPNPWGLYDMNGNLWEWCNDFFDPEYYAKGETANPRGPASGEDRVLRGGGFKDSPESCRSSARSGDQPGGVDVCFGFDAYGFRCVRRASAEDLK